MRLEDLVRALQYAPLVDEWVVREVRRQFAEVTGAVHRSGDAGELELVLWRDVRGGRGAATVTIEPTDAIDPAALVGSTSRRAANAVGPSWRLPPPAAPARVEVFDPAFDNELLPAATDLFNVLAAVPNAATPAARITTTTTRIASSSGFTSSYRASELQLWARMAGNATAPLAIRCRRLRDARVQEHAAQLSEQLSARATATTTTPGRYDLLLVDAAWMPPAVGQKIGFGWLDAVVAQASATLARRRLGLYRVGQAIYAEHEVTGDRLSVTSDGTLPAELLSAPMGELGEPVRRFELVRDGVVAGLSLPLREAALLDQPANGGVRNLVVATGSLEPAAKRRRSRRPLLEVLDLAWLEVDPRTGGFSAELGFGWLHDDQPRPIRGGGLRGNVFELLARARYSSESARLQRYHGPDAVRIDDVFVH